MAKGKREYNRPPAGGIVRNDYHRPNRKENKSTHKHSFGRAVQVRSVEPEALCFNVPLIPREELIEMAIADWEKEHTPSSLVHYRRRTCVERKCVDYIRHRRTNYDAIIQTLFGAAYVLATRRLFDAIADVYPWLKNECDLQYGRRAAAQNGRYRRYVVTPDSLTSAHVQEFNDSQAPIEQDAFTEEDEVPAFFNSLSSLDQSRFLYLPPFVKGEELRRRRFGENANDRWWEWEEELGLISTEGRANPKNAQQ